MSEASGHATDVEGMVELRPIEDSAKGMWVGLVVALTVFCFWMSFSSNCITFYRDDNVIATGPLLIEAARQVKSGEFPVTLTWSVVVEACRSLPSCREACSIRSSWFLQCSWAIGLNS